MANRLLLIYFSSRYRRSAPCFIPGEGLAKSCSNKQIFKDYTVDNRECADDVAAWHPNPNECQSWVMKFVVSFDTHSGALRVRFRMKCTRSIRSNRKSPSSTDVLSAGLLLALPWRYSSLKRAYKPVKNQDVRNTLRKLGMSWTMTNNFNLRSSLSWFRNRKNQV